MSSRGLRRGCLYALVRKASSAIDVTFEGLWEETTKAGGTRARLLFSAGPRALSKYGRKTRPKLIVGQDYVIERPSGSLRVRLVATTSATRGRLLVLRPRRADRDE
jgi:hypothetical protein